MQALQGRSVLVTGSTSGIGASIAEAFCRAGCNVMLNGFGSSDAIEGLRSRLADSYGVQVAFHGADLTRETDLDALLQATRDQIGDIDILVNNAGTQHVSPVEDFPADKWELILRLNLTAVFLATKKVVPSMKKKGWGRIINIASAHGLVASPYKSAYVSAKHGVLGFTKTVALELAEHGVRVNAICPGYVRTPLVESQIADTARVRGMSEEEVIQKVILEAQPTHEFVEADEIADAAVFLCSAAGNQINGAEIKMDGGWTAR